MANPGSFDNTVDQVYGPGTGQRNTYHQDAGLMLIPVSGPVGTPPKIVRLHAGYGVRVTAWAATKQGNPPIVPAMQNSLSGDVFMTGDITFAQPQVSTNLNTVDYAIGGTYTFVQPLSGRQAVNGGDWFDLGQSPQTPQGVLAEAQLNGLYPNCNFNVSLSFANPDQPFAGAAVPSVNAAGNPAGNVGVDFTNPLCSINDPTNFVPDYFSGDIIS